ncbi:MAG: carboxypeptidase-like regulatory domain-containing protein [Myxococcales bacterium]
MNEKGQSKLRLGLGAAVIVAALGAATGIAFVVLKPAASGSTESANPSRPAATGRLRPGLVEAPAPKPVGPVGATDPSRRMRGVVLDENGEPVPGVDVLLFTSAQSPGPFFRCPGEAVAMPLFDAPCPEAGAALFELIEEPEAIEPVPLLTVRTDEKGEFAIDPPGEPFDLYVQRGSSSATLTDVDPSGSGSGAGAAEQDPVSPSPPSESEAEPPAAADERLELQLTEGEEVTGRVSSGEQPVPGADVVVAQLRPLRLWRASAGTDGEFSFGVLPAGPMVGIAANAAGYLPLLQSPLFLGESVSLELARPGVVLGVVRIKGEPAAGAQVSLNSGSQTAVTDAEGRFSFPAVACEVCEVVGTFADRWAREDVALDEHRKAQVELELLPVGELVVHLVDQATGEPLDGTMSCNCPTAPESTSTGLFVLSHAPRGPLELMVQADGHVPKHGPVEVGPGTTEVTFALELEQRLDGQVLGEDGSPLAQATVSCYLDSGAGRGDRRDRRERPVRAAPRRPRPPRPGREPPHPPAGGPHDPAAGRRPHRPPPAEGGAPDGAGRRPRGSTGLGGHGPGAHQPQQPRARPGDRRERARRDHPALARHVSRRRGGSGLGQQRGGGGRGGHRREPGPARAAARPVESPVGSSTTPAPRLRRPPWMRCRRARRARRWRPRPAATSRATSRSRGWRTWPTC